jgi:hypothetical protein
MDAASRRARCDTLLASAGIEKGELVGRGGHRPLAAARGVPQLRHLRIALEEARIAVMA